MACNPDGISAPSRIRTAIPKALSVMDADLAGPGLLAAWFAQRVPRRSVDGPRPERIYGWSLVGGSRTIHELVGMSQWGHCCLTFPSSSRRPFCAGRGGLAM